MLAKFNPIMQEHRDSRNCKDSTTLVFSFLLFFFFFIIFVLLLFGFVVECIASTVKRNVDFSLGSYLLDFLLVGLIERGPFMRACLASMYYNVILCTATL